MKKPKTKKMISSPDTLEKLFNNCSLMHEGATKEIEKLMSNPLKFKAKDNMKLAYYNSQQNAFCLVLQSLSIIINSKKNEPC